MAFYVKDEDVDRLAEEVQAASGAKTKTEAVRIALQQALDRPDNKKDLRMKLEGLQAEVRRISNPDPKFDMKSYTDMMWGD